MVHLQRWGGGAAHSGGPAHEGGGPMLSSGARVPPGCIPNSPALQVSLCHIRGLSPSPPSCPVLPISVPSPPPSSCWEWRLHFSCHLHSQSIRTPQLSRLAELGGRRRRERVLWGLSPPHRSHSAPDCFLLCGAQPAGQGGSGNPAASLPPGTRAGGWRAAKLGGGCGLGSLYCPLARWRALSATPTSFTNEPH